MLKAEIEEAGRLCVFEKCCHFALQTVYQHSQKPAHVSPQLVSFMNTNTNNKRKLEIRWMISKVCCMIVILLLACRLLSMFSTFVNRQVIIPLPFPRSNDPSEALNIVPGHRAQSKTKYQIVIQRSSPTEYGVYDLEGVSTAHSATLRQTFP